MQAWIRFKPGFGELHSPGYGRTRYYLYTMQSHERITSDPAVAHGKPVIRGTRLPLSVVVGSMVCGMSFEEVQREYDVTAEDIRAALRFVRNAGAAGVHLL